MLQTLVMEFYFILTSILGTFLAILIGVPIGDDRYFLVETAPESLKDCKTSGRTTGWHSLLSFTDYWVLW